MSDKAPADTEYVEIPTDDPAALAEAQVASVERTSPESEIDDKSAIAAFERIQAAATRID